MKKNTVGIAAFAAVHVVCCVGLLLFAVGVLSLGGVVAWFGSGSARVVGIALLSVVALVVLVLLARRGVFNARDNNTGEPEIDR